MKRTNILFIIGYFISLKVYSCAGNLCKIHIGVQQDGLCKKSLPKVNIGKKNLNYALKELKKWEREEKGDPFYSGEDIPLSLPLFSMLPVMEVLTHQDHHYIDPRLAYPIRRAAFFVTKLFEKTKVPLKKLYIGDISNKEGLSPPGHPGESHHFGLAIDIQYITKKGGDTKLGGRVLKKEVIDIEKNFWLLYLIGKDNRIRGILTAYPKAFESYAKEAFNKGLISQSVLKSFTTNKYGDSAILAFDPFQNHDRHLHINLNRIFVEGKYMGLDMGCANNSFFRIKGCSFRETINWMFSRNTDRYNGKVNIPK